MKKSAACSECGTDLDAACRENDFSDSSAFAKKSASLTDVPIGRKGVSAVLDIVCGSAAAAVGFFGSAFLFGIPLLLVGLVWIAAGSAVLKRRQTGKCPYCGVVLTVRKKQTSFQCPVCGGCGIKAPTALETRDFN